MDIRLLCTFSLALSLLTVSVTSQLMDSKEVHLMSPYSNSLGPLLGFGERNGTDNRKPSFKDCKNYAPIVKEEQPRNDFVVQVEAYDPDGDDIEYSFVMAATEQRKFNIDSRTGQITTYHTFDRDEPIREKEVCCFLLIWLTSSYMNTTVAQLISVCFYIVHKCIYLIYVIGFVSFW